MAGGSELLIRLGVETASAQKNIREVNKELKSLKDQIALANTATGNYNKTSQGLSQQLSLQEKSLEALNTKLKLQKEVYEKNRQELEKRKDKLEELQKTESENTKEIKKAQEQVEQAQRQLNQANRDIQKTEAEIEAMNRTIGATKTALQEVEKQAKVQAIQQWADETSNKFKAVSKACTSMAMALTPMAMVISSAFKSAFQSASEFEQGLANVQAVAGFTQEELSQVRDEAKRLGQELPITAKDCADGFGYLALAGYDLEQQLASIEPIAKASVAWQEDLGTTSDLVTDSLSSLGMEVEDLGKYLNVVSQAQASSNTTATDMLKAYIQVGGVLNGLNIPLEESASLLGIMANRGVKAQEAGNALSSVMANLTTGTGRAGKALEALGISAFDSTGNFRGMEAILTDLNKAFSAMSEEEANYYKAMIGGKEHVSDLNALLAGMSDEYYELKEAISQSSGKLEEMYDIMQDTVQGKMASLSSKLEAIGLKFYDAFEKPIKAILDRLIELSDWFLKLPDSVVVAIGIIGGIVVVLVPVLLMIGMIANAISNMVSLWGMVQTAMIGMEIAIAPILAIVGAIVALGVALVVAYNKCEWFRNVVNETFAFIKDFVLQMWDEITKAVQNFVDFATPYIQAFLSAMSQWWTETKANIVNMWVEFQAWFAPYWETIKDVLSTVWEGIKTVFNDTIEIIVKGVKDHFNRLKEFWEEHGETIIDLFTTVWNAIETVFTTVIEGIKNFVTTKFEFLKKFWEEHGENIKIIFKAVWDAIKFIFETVISKISEHIVNNFRKIAEWWETWGEDVKHGFSVLWDVVCAIFETAWNIITGKCQIALDIIGGIIDVIAKLIKGDFAGAFESAKETIKKVVDTICDLVQNIINAWSGIGDKIAGFFGNISDKIAQKFSGLGDAIMRMLPSWLRTLINGGNPFKSMVSNAVNSLTGMFRMIEAPTTRQADIAVKASISSPYGLMDSIVKHDINYGRDAYVDSAYISSSSADSRNLISNQGSLKESMLSLSGIDQLVNQNNQLINLLTQFISNQQDSGFTITVEHMEVKDKSDIRSIAREMEELRKLQVLARGGV